MTLNLEPLRLRLAAAKKELRLARQAKEAASDRYIRAGLEYEDAQGELDEAEAKGDGDGE